MMVPGYISLETTDSCYTMCSGTFVVAVVGVALCCIIAVVGVGFILHRPVSCPGSSSPLSDNSPTFHSAKLAFSSRSPDDKTSNSKQLSR